MENENTRYKIDKLNNLPIKLVLSIEYKVSS